MQTPSINTISLSEPKVYRMDIKFDKLPLPKKETAYICKYFHVDELAKLQTGLNIDTKYHAIEFESHITKFNGNHMIHHMGIFGCPENFPESKIKKEAFDCTDNPMPECNRLTVVSVPGNDSTKLPEETGFIWGSGDTKVILLQVHYHNPSGVSGDIDSSGYTVRYTPKLRKYDTGIMVLGLDLPFINIPPRTPKFSVESVCGTNCTSKMNGKITVYGYLSHVHLTATGVMTQFRDSNGNVLKQLGEKNYRFEAQTLRIIEPQLELGPGFTSTTTCIYNTTKRFIPVHGDPGSIDEMCANLIYYYPRENGLSYCTKSNEPIRCIANNPAD
jgi:hypothetical protein